MSSIIGGAVAGAVGGGLAVTVLAPLTAANNFLGSYFFGSGMILGERQMYQDDWIKIKKRLDAGESFLVILEEVMKPNTQAVMQMARQTVIAVSDEWNKIVLDYIQSIPQIVWDAILQLSSGQKSSQFEWPLGVGVVGIVNGEVKCHSDYHKVGNTCVLNENAPPPTKEKTNEEKKQEEKEKDKNIQETLDKLKPDKSIVGSGLNRKQIISAIKFQENFLQQLYDKLKFVNKKLSSNPSHTISKKVKINTLKRIAHQIIVVREYKKALSWLNHQGTGGAKTTP